MATRKWVTKLVSELPGVKAEVHAKGRAIQARAEALFAAHDRPGGHKIVGEKRGQDYLVSIEGDVPHVIEFGREAYTNKQGKRVGPMEGLRILGRAVDE